MINGVLQEQPKIQDPSIPHIASIPTQAGHENKQILNQNEMIFSKIPPPEELNLNQLNSLFKFKQGSYLKDLIIDKTNVYKTFHSLAEILTVLKNVVRGEKLFDPNNPSIILCST